MGCLPAPIGLNTSHRSTMPSSMGIGTSHSMRIPSATSVLVSIRESGMLLLAGNIGAT
jgi:hypothetical protein